MPEVPHWVRLAVELVDGRQTDSRSMRAVVWRAAERQGFPRCQFRPEDGRSASLILDGRSFWLDFCKVHRDGLTLVDVMLELERMANDPPGAQRAAQDDDAPAAA